MSINLIENLSNKINWDFGCKAIIILSALELDLNFKKVSSENNIISTDELALLGKLEEANR